MMMATMKPRDQPDQSNVGDKNAFPVPLSKNLKEKLASNLNEQVASGPSNFARKQLEKFGWTDGMGLGKRNHGRNSHIKIDKKEDCEGVGFKEEKRSEWTNQWWYTAYQSTTLKNIGTADSSDSDSSDSDTENIKKRKRKHGLHSVPTDEELFEALGGARFGMRAQSSQTGKIRRAEELFEAKMKSGETYVQSHERIEKQKAQDAATAQKKGKKGKKAKKRRREPTTGDDEKWNEDKSIKITDEEKDKKKKLKKDAKKKKKAERAE